MNAIPFVSLDDPRYGESVQVSPLVRRVIANNPSKYTYLGTGTYIIGHGDVAVIDPGPVVDEHRQALVDALAGDRVRAILITHCHSDHSPLAALLRGGSGAPTMALGPHASVEDDEEDEDDAIIDDEVEPGKPLGETIDTAFQPDVRLDDGDVAAKGAGWTMRAVHTPGHTSNHMCYALEQEAALFSGDHVMGWSTTIVSPPDDDMRSYIESLHKLISRADATLWPTHGAPVTEPEPFLGAFLEHRLQREAQVLQAVRSGHTAIDAMVKDLYADVREELHKAAGRSVKSHLIKLAQDGRVTVAGKGKAAQYFPT